MRVLFTRSIAVLALSWLTLTAGCGNLSSNIVVDPATFDQVYTSREALPSLVDAIARPLIEDGSNIGLVIGVLDGEDKQVFSFGRKTLTSDEAPDGDTIFAIGSVTKVLMSLVAQQLIDEGALSLSDDLGHLLPPDSDLSGPAKKITIGQLMTHSSALPRQPNDEQMFLSLINYQYTGENIYQHIDTHKVLRLLHEFDPDPAEIGTYRYSNIGSGLLAKAIEAKTTKSLATLLDERILGPIGAKDTTFNLTAEQRTRVATGHVGDSPLFVRRNTPMDQWDMGDLLTGASGLYSTANDLLELVRYQIALGTPNVDIIPIRRNILSVSNKAEQKRSLGWSVDDFEKYDTQIIFSYGIISGYSTYIGVDPQRKIGVVVLANNFNWDDYIGHNLLLALARKHTGQREILTQNHH